MSIIKKYTQFLEEKEITIDGLDKLKDNEVRGDKLIKKIRNQEPLTLDKTNKLVTIDKMKDKGNWIDIETAIGNLINSEGNFDLEKARTYLVKSGRYTFVFQDKDGKEFKLNQFKKTKDLGSSGAGSTTKQVESLQSIFLSIKQSKPDSLLTPENLLTFYREWIEQSRELQTKLLFIPEDIEVNEELLKMFSEDKNWIKSFCDISNELWLEDDHIDHSKKYVIYQANYKGNNSPAITLQKLFKNFSRLEGFTDTNFFKWCPADVFLVSTEINETINEMIEDCKNISGMTELCDNLFDAGLFIPISLKKIGKSPLTIITNREVDKDLPSFELKRFIINSEPFRGINSKISTTAYWRYRDKKLSTKIDRIMNFDSSNTTNKNNIDGEVEGSTSRHGKISLKAIRKIINSTSDVCPTIPEIDDASILKKFTIEELEKKCENLNSEFKKRPKVIKYDNKRGTNIKGHEGRLISRIQSLQVVLALNEIFRSNPETANEVVTAIMLYALSIKTDKFVSPRYLRIL